MSVRPLQHEVIDPFLASDPLRTVSARHVIAAAPSAKAPAVVDPYGNVEGTMVCGRWCGVPEVPEAWIHARTPLIAGHLARWVVGPRRPTLCYALAHEAAVREWIDDAEPGRLRRYVLTWPTTRHDLRVVAITADSPLHDAVRAAVGGAADTSAFGILDDGVVVAMCRVRTGGGAVAIEAPFTAEGQHRLGLGRDLLGDVARQLAAEGRSVVFEADEADPARCRLAEATGFELWERWAYLPAPRTGVDTEPDPPL